MFRLALEPGTLVVNCFDSNSKLLDLGLRRAPNDWEVGELVSLLGLLGNTNLGQGIGNKWVWVLNKRGYFTTKSLCVNLKYH